MATSMTDHPALCPHPEVYDRGECCGKCPALHHSGAYQALTKGMADALAAMPAEGYIAAGKRSPFNGRVMWQLHEKGYVETPNRRAVPTLYRRKL